MKPDRPRNPGTYSERLLRREVRGEATRAMTHGLKSLGFGHVAAVALGGVLLAALAGELGLGR